MDQLTIRARLAQVAARFARLELAIFTSFNFNADFFEQNVLPTLFGAEENESRSACEQRVHRALVHTRVGVFYDPSQLRPSLVPYRYAACPVFLKQRLFHPKNIILFGTDADNKPWIYLAALSANLTVSGWGCNCEGLADTWIHARTEQPARALAEFVQWLESAARVGNEGVIRAANAFFERLQGKRHLSDPEGGAYKDKELVRAYFSPEQTSLWSFLRAEYRRIEGVLAASPYWGNCSRIASELEGLPLQLVAARGPTDFGHANLGEDSLSQLRGRTRLAPPLAWPVERDRFFHVKLYEVQTALGAMTGIGSCNFTAPGQFWDAAGGNVESMLFDAGAHEWPSSELPQGQIRAISCDEAPPPLPVYVHVQYDWKNGTFSWLLDGVGEVELMLPDGGPSIRLDRQVRKGKRAGELRSRLFRFRVGGDTFEGAVSELNLEESTQGYGGRLSPAEILESWRTGAITEPPVRGRERGGEGSDDDPLPMEPDTGIAAFDWFLFFRSLTERAAILQDLQDGDKLLEHLVSRSDSVVALVSSVLEGELPVATRWIVLTECLRLLERYGQQLAAVHGHVRKLRRVGDQLQMALIQQVSEIPQIRLRDTAPQIVDWYAHRLKRNA